MSSILYREGKGTIEHGIECESTNCEPGEVDGLLAAGWSANPPGYVPPEPVAVAEPAVDKAEEIDDVKEWLDDQIENLQAQVRTLTDLDESSKSEVARLNRELEAFQSIEIERDNLLAEVARLEGLLNQAPEEAPAATPEDDDVDESNLNPVRLAAKEKGIEGWDTKRIATLEKMLEA